MYRKGIYGLKLFSKTNYVESGQQLYGQFPWRADQVEAPIPAVPTTAVKADASIPTWLRG